LTWGWTDGFERSIPTFVFQNKQMKRLKRELAKDLLLICAGSGISHVTYDVYTISKGNLEMYQVFVNQLSSQPRDNLILRLHQSTKNHSMFERGRWLEFDSRLRVDEGGTNINDLISGSKLVVHGYDSTGILLTLSQNIPSIAFWMNGFEHLSDEVIKDYQLLFEAGIVHLNAESAAEFVNEIWNDIDAWWNSELVQTARLEFCSRFARTSSNIALDLKTILFSLTGQDCVSG
jgi:putative transferase (TIGR04331 family)